ncbi:MAG: hypothetical protein Ct9H90mP16_01800 [Candidatus Poseidoniales archaeon]|nr:MAG: hypothetical protein Ct9H90mP16_01800 [Candidatus Poseidoniales archaeon]
MTESEISKTETYDELAQSSEGNVSSTFEDMDTAGAVAEWMIWIGNRNRSNHGNIVSLFTCTGDPSRPTLLAGSISSAVFFFHSNYLVHQSTFRRCVSA